MTDEDLVLFGTGGRLVVSLVRLPSLALWQGQLQVLGIGFRPSPDFELEPGVMTVRAELEVAPEARLPQAPRLAARGVLGFDMTVELREMPKGVDEQDMSREEAAQLRRCHWQMTFSIPRNTGDLLPTALAVSLLGDAGGVVYHSGLDQAVVGSGFGTPPAILLAKLIWYADHLELLEGELDRQSLFPDCAVLEVAQLVVDAAQQQFGQALEREPLEQLLWRMIDSDRVKVEVLEPHERWPQWAGRVLAFVHLWLQGRLSPRRALGGPEWYELQQRIEQVLRRAGRQA